MVAGRKSGRQRHTFKCHVLVLEREQVKSCLRHRHHCRFFRLFPPTGSGLGACYQQPQESVPHLSLPSFRSFTTWFLRSRPYLERRFRFFRGRAVLLQPVTVFPRSVDREYSVVDLLELAETDLVRDRQSILDQSILPMIFVISAAEKARSVSVRTLPSAPRLKFSDIAADSSGASTMVTMS